MEMLSNCGYTVLYLISDKNRINQNMFAIMCGGNIKPYIENPYDKSTKIFYSVWHASLD